VQKISKSKLWKDTQIISRSSRIGELISFRKEYKRIRNCNKKFNYKIPDYRVI